MIRTIIEPDYEKCPYCNQKDIEKEKLYRFGFWYNLKDISISMEGTIRFCPICGKELISLDEWKQAQIAIYADSKENDKYTMWDFELTEDNVEEIDKKRNEKINLEED